jgi:hypothetical protein
VDKVISSGGTAIAVAAEPTLGRAGYWLMTVTALFATMITAAHVRIRAETGPASRS